VPVTELPSGIRITVSSDYRVAITAAGESGVRHVRRIDSPTGPVPLPPQPGIRSAENEAIINAMEGQELRLVDEAALEPEPSEEKRRAAPAAEDKTHAEFSLEVEGHEGAVLLTEQDGFYSWVLPTDTQTILSGAEKRGARTVTTRQRVVFQIEVRSAGEPAAGPSRRGFIKDFVFGRIRAFVFKFAARTLVGYGMKFLERNVRKGIVRIASVDPAQWSKVEDLSTLHLPDSHPARVLLLVHGTFSSTLGAFGALGSTPWGTAWLQGALANYDLVIGFDHPTLSEDPLENATDLLGFLEKITWPLPPHFDVVVHSRGALVFRSLVENLLPGSSFRVFFDAAVFVAGTNGGTLLAAPDKWQHLIDLYTNLTVASCRVIGLMPQAKAVTLILQETIQGLGAFLKYCATTAVTERKVPGLAAMEPDGDFVKGINQTQPGQPTIEKSFYCVVMSKFMPQIVNGEAKPKELPLRLVSWILEVLVKQLMAESNDLVVNAEAMTAIDLIAGNFIKDKLDFGENPEVYHTNYFTRPEVVNAMARWFNLITPPAVTDKSSNPADAKQGGKRTLRQRGGSAVAGTIPQKVKGGRERFKVDVAAPVHTNYYALLGQPSGLGRHRGVSFGGIVAPPAPASLDTDFIVRHIDTPMVQLVDAVKKKAPSYVVVRRPYQDQTLNYAYTGEEILGHYNAASSETLLDALNLHETDSSISVPISQPILAPAVARAAPTSRRIVVLDGDRPVGIMPDKTSLLTSNLDLVELAKVTANPKTDTEKILTTRAMPTMVSVAAPPEKTAPAPEAMVACHFFAEMDEQVLVKRVTTIAVVVSREIIRRIAGAAAKGGEAADVDPSRNLIIQVIPKLNFEVVDSSRMEIPPPAPGDPQTFYFDVRPTDTGQGEIWVIARQGPVSLVTLVLSPLISDQRTATRRISSAADTPEAAKPPGPINRLNIFEERNGDQISYRYELESPSLKVLQWRNGTPFIGSRENYVNNIYKAIEQRWLSNASDYEAFTQELRAFGAQLLDELIPKDLQKTLWDFRDKLKSIMVISTEPFIPWELVHLKDPATGMPKETCFLGQMGLVRWLDQGGWPEEEIPIREGHARYVIPQYPHPDYVLKEAEKEADFLIRSFNATAVTPQPKEVLEVLQKTNGFDLLHFACHGFAEHGNIANAELLLQGRIEGEKFIPARLSATTAGQFSNWKSEHRHPMVVLNACQAARAGYTLTGVGGFAQAFISAGAGCFVSSLWSVGDQPARTFTETLYSQLIAGKTLSIASITARNAAKDANDATWLAYAVYGNPYMRIKK
jgi:hypothetical protein